MKTDFYIIDRIEDGSAVLEINGREIKEVSFSEIPFDSKEGDVLTFDGGRYIINREMTALRRERAAKLQKRLFNKSKDKEDDQRG